MDNDLTMETNHWIMEDPAWANYSKSVCTKDHYWTGYCGTDFFIRTQKSKGARFWVRWPNIAEHFYALKWRSNRWDTIFASYSLSEIKRFIDTIDWPMESKRWALCVVDEVTKENIPITKFIGIIH